MGERRSAGADRAAGRAADRAAAPITLIISADEFLAAAALAEVRDPLAAAGWAVEEIPAAETGTLSYALETLSLLDTGRLVVVRDAEALAASTLESIAAWSATAPEGVRLVLVARAAGRLKKTLGAQAHLVESAAPPPWEVPRWVVGWFRRLGRPIAPEAAEALVEAVGTDLRQLATSAEQLLTVSDGPVDVAAVARLFRGFETQVWTFVDAVLDGDRAGGLRHLRGLLAQGEHPIALAAALARQLRAVALVSDGRRGPASAYAKELGVKEGAVKRAFRQARRFDGQALRRAFRILADADLALKGGEVGESHPPELILELAVVKVAGLAPAGAAAGRRR